ncbi:MAG: PKD domain-containing protein [Chitinophagales bacterium]|nr:PKD domain-containing protein [Chitinophagales bacterium]MBP6154089.1 PKD domain-containing protein [Chitinophagales bacterium]
MKKIFGILAIFAVVISTSCKKKCVAPTIDVVAAFSVPSMEGFTSALSYSVTFENESTGATSYLWNFGDGTTSTAENPTHEYTSGGAMEVKLTASNGNVKATATKTIYIYNETD